MIIRFTLTKPFRKMEEGRDFRPSILAYGKFPYIIRERDGKVVKSQRRLYINLYLIEIGFDWITHES